MIGIVVGHTAYLAGGFAMNLLISVLSMVIGTILGGLLGRMRFRRMWGVSTIARFATSICRNVPSFVLLFYMASMIPSEIEWSGAIVAVPLWIKATLALIFPVVGFASDQSLGYFRQHDAGLPGAGETFGIAWMQYFLIIIMASATASVIGADEIIGRANTLIAQYDDPQLLIVIYVYVSMWFLATGLLLSALLNVAMSRRAQRNNAT